MGQNIIPKHILDTIFLESENKGITVYDKSFYCYNIRLYKFMNPDYICRPTGHSPVNCLDRRVIDVYMKQLYLIVTFRGNDDKKILYKYALALSRDMNYVENHLREYLQYIVGGNNIDSITHYNIIKFETIYDDYVSWYNEQRKFDSERISKAITKVSQPMTCKAINKFGEIFVFDPLRIDHGSSFPVTSAKMPDLKKITIYNLWVWYFYPAAETSFGFLIADSEDEAWEVIRSNNIYENAGGTYIENVDTGNKTPAYAMTIKSLSSMISYIDSGTKFISNMYYEANAFGKFINNVASMMKGTSIIITYKDNSYISTDFNNALTKYRNAVELIDKESDNDIALSEITSIFGYWILGKSETCDKPEYGYKHLFEDEVWLWAFEPYSIDATKYGFVYGKDKEEALKNLEDAKIISDKQHTEIRLFNLIDDNIMKYFDKATAVVCKKVVDSLD